MSKEYSRYESIQKVLDSSPNTGGKPTRITVILSRKAAIFFAELMYAMTKPDGSTPANQSEVISEVLETVFDFELLTDDQLPNWINTNFPDRVRSDAGSWAEKYKK